MKKTILLFRCKQFTKIVKDIPFLYRLLILGMTAFAGIYLFSALKDQTAAMIISLIFLFLVWLIQEKRKDYRFMHLVAACPPTVFCLEYLLLSLPLLLALAIHRHWIIAGAVLLGILLTAWKKQTDFHLNSGLIRLPEFIRFSLFELRCGIRQYGLFLPVAGLIALGTLPFPYVSLGIFWFLTLFLTEMFRTSEPLNILCSVELPPAGFLHRKLKINLAAYLCVITPLCLAYAAVHPGDWWLSLYYLAYMTANVALVVVSKYACYSPGEKIMGGQVAIMLSFFGVAVPVLFPLTLCYLIKHYLAARRNLKLYLDAYDTELTCGIQ